MNTTQKIIKGLAIALAVFIIFNILVAIISFVGAISGITYISNLFNTQDTININYDEVFDINKVKRLELEASFSNVNIIQADVLRVEAQNVTDRFSCNIQGDKLIIKEDKNRGINFSLNSETESTINIYIPENTTFNDVEIDFGVGNCNVDYISANNVDITSGVGNTVIEYLESLNKCDIELGVGEFEIVESNINNLDFESGMGNYILNSSITGVGKIESGIGNGQINLVNFDSNNSKIRIEKGIGNIKINGEEYSNNQTYGNGKSNIDIKGGMGNIDITVNE